MLAKAEPRMANKTAKANTFIFVLLYFRKHTWFGTNRNNVGFYIYLSRVPLYKIRVNVENKIG